MSQYIVDSRVINGHLKLQDIPLADDTEVKVNCHTQGKSGEDVFSKNKPCWIRLNSILQKMVDIQK